MSAGGHQTADNCQPRSSSDHQSTASYTQGNDHVMHEVVTHLSPSGARAEMATRDACKGAGVRAAWGSLSLQDNGGGALECESPRTAPLQEATEILSFQPRLALSPEGKGSMAEHKICEQTHTLFNGEVKLDAANRASETGLGRDQQDFTVQHSHSTGRQPEASDARFGCPAPPTHAFFGWWRRCEETCNTPAQCSRAHHGKLVTILPRSSRNRVAEYNHSEGPPDQSNEPGCHAFCGDAPAVKAFAHSSTCETPEERTCHMRKGPSSSPINSRWLTFQHVLRMGGKCASKLKQKFSAMMDRGFSRHATLVYDYKWHFIVASFVVSGLMAVGLLFRKHENDMYKLYSFSGAPSYRVKEQFLSHFPRLRTSYIIAYSDYDSLKPDTLAALNKIDEQVRNITLHRDAITVDEFGDPLERHARFSSLDFPSTVTFEDVCARDSWGDCSVMSVLNMYPSPHAWGRPIVCRKWPIVVNFRTKKAYRADAMLGNVTVEKRPHGDAVLHVIQNATAFGIRYDFLGEGGWEHYSAAVEKRIEEIVFHSEVPGMRLALRAERSISDDLIRSSQLGQWDSVLLTVAVLVVLLYTLGVNSTLTFRTKTLPAFMGVLSTLFGYAGGAGFIYLCGLLHTPPAEATPFLVLGIGVDNAFVLINSYSLTFLIADPRERIRHTTRDAGLAITCTTMTSVTALIIGAASPYASISMFCVITAFCLLWGYVMFLTFFLGWLALDAQREARHLQHHPLQCQRKGLSERALRSVKSPGCVEASVETPPDSQEPSEVENTLPDTFIPSAEACVSQKYTSSARREPASLERFNGDTHLCLKERRALGFFPRLNGAPDRWKPDAVTTLHLRASHTRCAAENETDGHRQAYQEAELTDLPECSVALAQAGKVSMKNHATDNALSQSQTCTRRDYGKIRERKAEYMSSAEEALILEKMKGMSTFQLASVMAFRPRLETTLNKIGGGSIRVRLAVPSGGSMGSGGGEEHSGRSRAMQSRHLPHSSEGGNTDNDVLVCPVDKAEKDQQAAFTDTGAGDRQHARSTDASSNCLIMNASHLKHWLDAYLREPKGNVGRLGRAFLIKYYCRLLAKPWIQTIVLTCFAALCAISIYGFTKIQPGITVDEICPKDSYLRTFFEVRSRYFSTLGEEITIFFPGPERWQDKALQDKLLDVHNKIYASQHAVAINNGMYHFIKQKQKDLIDGDKTNFLRALYTWLYNDLVGKQYRTNFVLSFPPQYSEGGVSSNVSGGQKMLPESLVSWKFVYWMPHVENTSVLYEWLKETRLILQDARPHFHGLAYTPLAILWESDPYILKCTVSNLLYALAAIVLMTVALIPNFLSMLIVAFIVFLVDLALCGFMAIWGLRLNMLTMVILLLAIGYSVDTITHVLNAFTRCCGETRRDRMVETMVLIGNAIANGMLSTLMAVLFLKGSDKFVLEVFFKMMVLVLAFAFGFGFILLPVLLQLVGPMAQNEQIVKFMDTGGKVSSSGCHPQGATSNFGRVKPATPGSLVQSLSSD